MVAPARAGDPLGDDGLDGVGNAGLKLAAPRPVQCGFDPDLVHDAIFLVFLRFRHCVAPRLEWFGGAAVYRRRRASPRSGRRIFSAALTRASS